MKIIGLEWDDSSIEKTIVKHHLNPKEVEDVCFGIHYAITVRYKRRAIYGKADTGKYLKVILERLHGSTYRVITAFPMNRRDRQLYREKMVRGG